MAHPRESSKKNRFFNFFLGTFSDGASYPPRKRGIIMKYPMFRFATVVGCAFWISAAGAAPLPGPTSNSGALFGPVASGQAPVADTDIDADLRPELRRQLVNYPTNASAGSVVIDTEQTFLYFVLGDGKAIRYGIGVGREGFTWSGAQSVSRKAEWPDWTPPSEMIARQPYLARWMAGGEGNPLGARAIYLGNTLYRIHGTNMPATIGQKVSSGCIRMLNADIIDLYSRVDVGTKIIVLPNHHPVATVASVLTPLRGAQAYASSAIY
jgi:lipoprotein-anchoring transpeptidase ErfK/SrfK